MQSILPDLGINISIINITMESPTFKTSSIGLLVNSNFDRTTKMTLSHKV